MLELSNDDTLLSIDIFAMICSKLEMWEDAEELEIIVSNLQKRLLDPEHPSTLTTLVTLAIIYKFRGRLKESQELAVHQGNGC